MFGVTKGNKNKNNWPSCKYQDTRYSKYNLLYILREIVELRDKKSLR